MYLTLHSSHIKMGISPRGRGRPSKLSKHDMLRLRPEMTIIISKRICAKAKCAPHVSTGTGVMHRKAVQRPSLLTMSIPKKDPIRSSKSLCPFRDFFEVYARMNALLRAALTGSELGMTSGRSKSHTLLVITMSIPNQWIGAHLRVKDN